MLIKFQEQAFLILMYPLFLSVVSVVSVGSVVSDFFGFS
jgi:hypothetical protein